MPIDPKTGFEREGQTLPALPLDNNIGGRVRSGYHMAVDMEAQADTTAALLTEWAHDDGVSMLARGAAFEREYAKAAKIDPGAPETQMPSIGAAARYKQPMIAGGKLSNAPKLLGKPSEHPILEMLCPKCNATAPGDWSQCRGTCPISMSPHYLK